jgi:hypothetical protein
MTIPDVCAAGNLLTSAAMAEFIGAAVLTR